MGSQLTLLPRPKVPSSTTVFPSQNPRTLSDARLSGPHTRNQLQSPARFLLAPSSISPDCIAPGQAPVVPWVQAELCHTTGKQMVARTHTSTETKDGQSSRGSRTSSGHGSQFRLQSDKGLPLPSRGWGDGSRKRREAVSSSVSHVGATCTGLPRPRGRRLVCGPCIAAREPGSVAPGVCH